MRGTYQMAAEDRHLTSTSRYAPSRSTRSIPFTKEAGRPRAIGRFGEFPALFRAELLELTVAPDSYSNREAHDVSAGKESRLDALQRSQLPPLRLRSSEEQSVRLAEGADRVEEGIAEVGGLPGADAVDVVQIVERARTPVGHLLQRAIVEDHVGWNAALARSAAARRAGRRTVRDRLQPIALAANELGP